MSKELDKSVLPTATMSETIAVIGDVFVPNIAKGVIIRRPKAVGMAEKLGLLSPGDAERAQIEIAENLQQPAPIPTGSIPISGLQGGAGNWPMMQFSGGPGICPGRHVVLTVTSHMLARLLHGRECQLSPPDRLLSSKPMPPLLNNYDLTFKVKMY